MSCLGNIIWVIFGGLLNWLSWTFVGVVWCITLIGIPVGKQCFKMAKLSFMPFGKEIYYDRSSSASCLLNVIWIIFGGFWIALEHLISGCVLALTIIGIPFALQQFKLARLALSPFGARVINSYY